MRSKALEQTSTMLYVLQTSNKFSTVCQILMVLVEASCKGYQFFSKGNFPGHPRPDKYLSKVEDKIDDNLSPTVSNLRPDDPELDPLPASQRG